MALSTDDRQNARVSQSLCTVLDMIRMLENFPQDALLSFDGMLNYPSVELSTKQDGPCNIVTLRPSLWCRK